MKENRYFQMVYLLLEKGTMTAPQLPEYFEVSVRTIYRAIDILSAAGIPIYASQGRGGGISIQDNYVLKKSMLSQEEQKHILMALQSMQMIEGESAKSLLLKLSSVFQREHVDWLEIDFSSWTKSGAGKVLFQTLQNAILKSRKVMFLYCNGRGEVIERIIEPLKLVFKSYDWYVYGFCTLRNDFRFFKLTRIRKLTLCDEDYDRPIPDQLFKESENFAMDMIQVTLIFDPCMAFRIYDKFDDEITKMPDGHLLVETYMPDNNLLYSYILSCGENVEVIKPQSVREKIAARARNIVEKYKT